MQAETKAVLDAGLALPEEDRREVAELLMLSLPETNQEEIDAAWDEEIKRRLERIESGQDRLIPYEEAIALIRARKRV